MLTLQEVATRLGVSVKTVRGLISRGELTALLIGRFIRIRPSALEKYEKKAIIK